MERWYSTAPSESLRKWIPSSILGAITESIYRSFSFGYIETGNQPATYKAIDHDISVDEIFP
jgi:hypothetical protein